MELRRWGGMIEADIQGVEFTLDSVGVTASESVENIAT